MDLKDLGLNAQMLIAGFSGGIVHAFFFGERNWWAGIGSVVGGLFTSNYVGPWVSNAVSIPESLAGFVVGLTSLMVCQGIVGAVRGWKPKLNGGR